MSSTIKTKTSVYYPNEEQSIRARQHRQCNGACTRNDKVVADILRKSWNIPERKTKRPKTDVPAMASKRLSMIDYAEDRTSSDEDDDMLVDPNDIDDLMAQQDSRPNGRSRKPSLSNTNSSDTVTPVRRRGRGPSKRPCLNRNALMARENRQRKKEYIERIEAKLQNFQVENQELTSTIQKQNVEIKRLGNEVKYLKAVVKNQTTITALLKAMNDSLGRMHGDGAAQQQTSGNNGMTKPSVDVINWVVSGQTNSSKINNLSTPSLGTMTTTKNKSEIFRSDNQRQNYGQQLANIPVKIARKTMPFTTHSILLKNEDPSSVESIFEDDEQKNAQISSPQSGSFCEYITDKSPVVPDNQQPTTPMSVLSNSLDKAEANLSNADDLTQLNVDFLDLEDAVPLQFEQEDLFGNETLFQSDDVLTDNNDPLSTKDVPLSMNDIFDGINQKDNFSLNGLDNAGVCLHINSARVSLEYCSVCQANSFNSEILQN